mmetsp:Transcript_42152/g.98337  ORF Transcript_42152/g.98337 Transcript_42152/m.98337 type:complete len:163 (-) Transcript_42152:11-499(-)
MQQDGDQDEFEGEKIGNETEAKEQPADGKPVPPETAEQVAAVETETAKDAGKPTTLLQALGDQGNRDVARQFASFSAALAAVPVIGLFVTERALRFLVDDPGSRWIYSGAVAVVLVNAVLFAFVMWCFAEGFPEATAVGVRGTGDEPKQVCNSKDCEPKKSK